MTVISEVIHAVVELPGAVAGALVDLESGNCLIRAGREKMTGLSLVGAVNAQMLRAEMRQVQEQFPHEDIQDLMITVGKQYHLIRLVHLSDKLPCLFLYVVLARETANLMMARHTMAEVAWQLTQVKGVIQEVESAQVTALLRNSPFHEMAGFNTKRERFTEEDEKDVLPPFMREEAIMKLLATAEAACGLPLAA